MSFSRIPVITPYNRGDNLLYLKKYGRSIGTILHDLDLFKKSSEQEKIDAFIGLYLFSIVSVHMDLMGEPCGLENAKKFKNKIYIITNTIMHNPIIQKLGLLYLEIKLLIENDYKNMDQILNLLDDTLIFVIHVIVSFNYTKIKEFIQSYPINELPIIYETIYPELNIDLLLILSKINNDIIYNSFYRFDPFIEFNEYGKQTISNNYLY
jgi:hypothetical protein